MELTLLINFIEAVFLSWFISSLLDVKKNIWLYRISLCIYAFSITSLSNYLSAYDMLLTTFIIVGISVISLCFVTNHYFEILFVCCLETLLLCISASIATLLLSQINIDFIPIVCRIIYIICGCVMIYMLKKEKPDFDEKIYCSLSIIIYLVHFLVQYLLQIYLVIRIQTLDFLISFGLLIICMLILFYTILYMSKLYKNKEDYEKLLKDKTNEKVLSHLYNEVKMTKHDLKHDYHLIQYYLDHNNIESVKEMIKEKTFFMDNIPSLINSKNNIINIVINSKIIEAYSKQLKVQYRIVVGSDLSISDYDLNQLLSNILDNAIENCSKEGEIDIQILQEQDFLHIEISNSIEQSAIDKGFKTNKDKRYHGFGLKSIKKICQKYDANIEIKEQDHKFYIEITLIL